MQADNGNLVQTKVCTRCGEEKDTTEYYPQRKGKYGVTSRCKACCSELSADRYQINRDEILRKNREWVEENPDKFKAIMASWYQENKEDRKAKNKQWRIDNPERSKEHQNRHARKRAEDPKQRLEAAIKSGVRRGIDRGSKCGRRTFELLGYTVDELKNHLEQNFLPGMTWENYGEWHIDHKIPLSAHNYSSPDDIDFGRAWALTNLQPLWAVDNLKKRDKLGSPFQPSLSLFGGPPSANDNDTTTTTKEKKHG